MDGRQLRSNNAPLRFPNGILSRNAPRTPHPQMRFMSTPMPNTSFGTFPHTGWTSGEDPSYWEDEVTSSGLVNEPFSLRGFANEGSGIQNRTYPRPNALFPSRQLYSSSSSIGASRPRVTLSGPAQGAIPRSTVTRNNIANSIHGSASINNVASLNSDTITTSSASNGGIPLSTVHNLGDSAYSESNPFGFRTHIDSLDSTRFEENGIIPRTSQDTPVRDSVNLERDHDVLEQGQFRPSRIDTSRPPPILYIQVSRPSDLPVSSSNGVIVSSVPSVSSDASSPLYSQSGVAVSCPSSSSESASSVLSETSRILTQVQDLANNLREVILTSTRVISSRPDPVLPRGDAEDSSRL